MLRNGLRLTRRFAPQRRNISYSCNQKELSFVLNKVLNVPKHYEKLGYSVDMTSEDTVNSLIAEAAKFSEKELLSIREDANGEVSCHYDTKRNTVVTPSGWKEAYKVYTDNGWQSLSIPEQYGGQGFPSIFSMMRSEITATANWAWSMYSGLTNGATTTLLVHGDELQKKMCVPKMASGEWLGTMCLTEPHCGSDLGQMITTAEPTNKRNEYKLNGTKIFISCGDHDFGSNIIHIVLARLPNAPEGTKGISLFCVPKYKINHADGSSDTSKVNIQCTRIENKMGIHGSSTCEMVMEDSIGYLIGEPNTGLKQMFTFMNTARLGTAMQGLTTMELSYQNSVPYAKDRMAFRALNGIKYPNQVADPIIVHGDVRRMLLTMRSIMEPARAWLYSANLTADEWFHALNNGKHDLAAQLESELGLQTPILKGFLTELGNQAASDAIQIWGGHGYVKENGIEQIYRDARISTLYEGTTGIQALDLLGRKVMLNKGKLLNKYLKQVQVNTGSLLWGSPVPMEFTTSVLAYASQWKMYTYWMMYQASKNKDFVGAASYDYLMYSGYVNTAYWWLKVLDASSKHESSEEFQRRCRVAHFYFDRVLPRADSHARMMKRSPEHVMNLPDSDF